IVFIVLYGCRRRNVLDALHVAFVLAIRGLMIGEVEMARSCLGWNLSYAGVAAVMLGTTALSSAALAHDARHLDFFNRHFAQNFTTNSSTSTSTSTSTTQSQRPVDPGVRGGAPGAGDSLPGLSQNEINFFKAAQDIFNEVETVE